MQEGFIGTWGEWYYTTNYASPLDQSVNSAQQTARNTISAALLDALPSTRMIQLRTPGYKQVTLKILFEKNVVSQVFN